MPKRDRAKQHHSYSPPRSQKPAFVPRALTWEERIPVPGKFAVQWGHGHTPRVEFFKTHDEMAARLNRLWDDHHNEAQGRLATWNDVVIHHIVRQ